jgi:hypothetical protein
MQVFLTVSLLANITTIIKDLVEKITSTPIVLAQNLLKAYNYFFSYILIHIFTTVTLTLVEVNGLLALFVISLIFNKTAKQKWIRRRALGLYK